MMITKTILSFFTLGIIAFPTLSLATDAELAHNKCAACHGDDGNSQYPEVPSIAGLSRNYLYDSLKSFADGDRPGERFKPHNGSETDMNEVSRSLSHEEMKALAAYFSRQTFTPRQQSFDPLLARAGARIHKKRCERCHEDNGRTVDDDMGRLAGQSMQYLEKELKNFITQRRHPPKKMARQLKRLKPNDIPALVHFFAGQQS